MHRSIFSVQNFFFSTQQQPIIHKIRIRDRLPNPAKKLPHIKLRKREKEQLCALFYSKSIDFEHHFVLLKISQFREKNFFLLGSLTLPKQIARFWRRSVKDYPDMYNKQ